MFTETNVVAIALVLFLISLFKPIKNFALSFLDKKIQDAVKNLDRARELRCEAEEYLKSAGRKLQEAEHAALAIVNKAEERVNQIMDSVEAEVGAIADRKMADSLARIAQQEHQIASELKFQAVELAMSYVQDNLMKELDKDAQMSLITSSLKCISKMKH